LLLLATGRVIISVPKQLQGKQLGPGHGHGQQYRDHSRTSSLSSTGTPDTTSTFSSPMQTDGRTPRLGGRLEAVMEHSALSSSSGQGPHACSQAVQQVCALPLQGGMGSCMLNSQDG
jgi:hypothetical protein